MPLTGRAPAQSPVAVQPAALLDDHVICEVPPWVTAAGLVLRLSVGVGGLTFTVTVRSADPPGPVHVSAKLVVADSALLVAVPETGRLPVQPPDDVQAEAPVVDQVSVVVPPCATDVGFAVRLMVGTGGGVTLTSTDCTADPPGPVHVNVNVELTVSAPRLSVPAVPFVPIQAPDAAQLFALLVDQVSVLLPL